MNLTSLALIAFCCVTLSARSQTNLDPATIRALFGAGPTNRVEQINAVLTANPWAATARYPDGKTILFSGASGGNTNVLAAMIAHGAQVNVRDTNGLTPLHYAARWGSHHAVSFLLANKAEINARNNQGETPLRLALRSRPLEDADALLKESQTVTNYRAPDGSIIMRNRRAEAIKILYQHGATE